MSLLLLSPNLHVTTEQLRLVLAAAAVASVVVVVQLSSQVMSPTETLGWGRDSFGLYNYGNPNAAQQVRQYNAYATPGGSQTAPMQGVWGGMEGQQMSLQPGFYCRVCTCSLA